MTMDDIKAQDAALMTMVAEVAAKYAALEASMNQPSYHARIEARKAWREAMTALRILSLRQHADRFAAFDW
ncbi:hypothetical protein UFOVP810_33 [uncultured Caudovirales phage]|uniref:Uncharacterized protein n=1 Tax=uncultured Caudovirales phage TaxID=2100421 RepID=A0A6J5MZ03_9CAUD|nr:hypothetical protein UFOVP568_6 [uncultured Caudovirales phage]CAB4163580.1 hypothetical protein UFOVP810_33 [uncultured Caudovirales phage]